MKCGCFVLTELTHGGKRTKRTPVSWWHTELGPLETPDPEYRTEVLLAKGYKVCEGDLVAKVSAEDEIYMGGSSAILEVHFSCTTCGGQFYPHLPKDPVTLNEFITKSIAAIGSDEEQLLRDNTKESERKFQRDRQAMMDRFHQQQAQERAAKAARRAQKKVTH